MPQIYTASWAYSICTLHMALKYRHNFGLPPTLPNTHLLDSSKEFPLLPKRTQTLTVIVLPAPNIQKSRVRPQEVMIGFKENGDFFF